MTRRQKELFDYICGYWAERGYAPSYEEMALAMGIVSKSGIHRMVKALTERGFVNSLPGKARSVVLP